MKNIIEIKTLFDLQKLYDADAYVLEDCGNANLESLLEQYGQPDATGYLFKGELLYEACNLPADSSLPKDRVYLAIIPDKEIYEDNLLVSFMSLVWRLSEYTGFNLFELNRAFTEELTE